MTAYAIVGIGHRKAQPVVDQLVAGETVSLVREPDNSYDRLAVKVVARATHIGYVPKAQAAVLAPVMDAAGVMTLDGVFVDGRNPQVEAFIEKPAKVVPDVG